MTKIPRSPPFPVYKDGAQSCAPYRPGPLPANYQHWVKADLWTIERGILLLLNVETFIEGRGVMPPCESTIRANGVEIWQLAESSLKAGTLKKADGRKYHPLEGPLAEVLPIEFITWATHKGFEIPVELTLVVPTLATETHKKGAYQDRDNDFISWQEETKLDLENLTKDAIHKLLIKRNSHLWQSGFADWWRQQNFLKKSCGRKPKKNRVI